MNKRIIIIKCWKNKNDKIVKGMFYENANGRFLITFDKFALIHLLGSYDRYKSLKEGDELTFSIDESEV